MHWVTWVKPPPGFELRSSAWETDNEPTELSLPPDIYFLLAINSSIDTGYSVIWNTHITGNPKVNSLHGNKNCRRSRAIGMSEIGGAGPHAWCTVVWVWEWPPQHTGAHLNHTNHIVNQIWGENVLFDLLYIFFLHVKPQTRFNSQNRMKITDMCPPHKKYIIYHLKRQ